MAARNRVTPTGDGAPIARPPTGRAIVLTPPATVAVLGAGDEPVIHPSLATG